MPLKDSSWFLLGLPTVKYERGILLMEDLTRCETPYRVMPAIEVPSLDHTLMVFKALAHFHGAWWQILRGKSKTPNLDFLTQDFMNKNFGHPFAGFFSATLKRTLDIQVSLIAQNMEMVGEDKGLVERVRKHAARVVKEGAHQCVMARETIREDNLVTLIHGDSWINNIMFQEDEDGKPLDVKLIDYQVLRLLHPTMDLGYYIYISTDLPFREAHENTILEEYFNVLSGYLSPHYDITFDQFRAEFEARRPGFAFAGIVVSCICTV